MENTSATDSLASWATTTGACGVAPTALRTRSGTWREVSNMSEVVALALIAVLVFFAILCTPAVMFAFINLVYRVIFGWSP